jgi:uncharacterized protein YkwD
MRYAIGIFVVAATLMTAFAQGKPSGPSARPNATSTASRVAVKPTPAKATVPAGPSQAEQTIFDSVNRERAARQLKPLRWDAGLAAAARGHAQKMAQAGQISHQFPGENDFAMRIRLVGVKFISVAENVAEAPEVTMLHTEWMNSPPHRANILDPDLDMLGVSIVERNGQFFAVQDFALSIK